MIHHGDTLLLACRIGQVDSLGMHRVTFTAADGMEVEVGALAMHCRSADREPLGRDWPPDRLWLAGYLTVKALDSRDDELTVRLPGWDRVIVHHSQVPYRLEMAPTWLPTG